MEQMENVLRLYVLKEGQCHAVLGLLEQKDFVAVLPTGFGKTLIIFLFAAVKSNEDETYPRNSKTKTSYFTQTDKKGENCKESEQRFEY